MCAVLWYALSQGMGMHLILGEALLRASQDHWLEGLLPILTRAGFSKQLLEVVPESKLVASDQEFATEEDGTP